MKKNIALLLSIITLFLSLFFLRVNITKPKNTLGGEKIEEAIYQYDLKTENLTVNGIVEKGSTIYYLLMDIVDDVKDIYNYKLKKLDINTNQVTAINTIENTNSYCTLTEKEINCQTSTQFETYDFDLKKTFEYTSKVENLNANYLPYKDIYIKIDDQDIYLLRNEEKLYRTINSAKELIYEDYVVTSNNTILVLRDKEDYYYLYDINRNFLWNSGKQSYFKYKNGVFFNDGVIYEIHNLEEDYITSFTNPTKETYFYTGTLNEDNNNFYLYNPIDHILYIEDMENKTIKKLDVNLLSEDNPIAKLIVTEKYLYVYILQDQDNFFVINLEDLNLSTIDIEDYNNKLTKKINEQRNNIKETYQVNVKIKEEANIEFPDFSAKTLLNEEVISDSLYKIEDILSKYNEKFFESFYNNGFSGLNIYLTGELTPNDYETQVSNPAAYSLNYNGEYMIVIDIEQPNIEELLCHELLHNMEFLLNNQNIYPFKEWKNYNPSGFLYNNSYTKKQSYDYTLNEEDKNDVYFIDSYSYTYETEDRARVFERICSCEENSIINNYPNLYKKGLYLKEEIIKYFPSLVNTNLFSSLNDDKD
ncbi:putative uncharacterized protein [Mycoplasma sp. CAG:776]|mgnify:CR=1 FL=1|nr:putative uncharacterized protein [Mycoplasma sp. CAG:776]